MNISSRSRLVLRGKRPYSLMIHTNLYTLIAVINAEIDADRDDLVVAYVVHLSKTHRLTYLGTSQPRQLVIDQRRASRRRRDQTSTTAHSGESPGCVPRMLPSRFATSTRYPPSI
jgi:hypothetical protein